jgi:hypothetical protein
MVDKKAASLAVYLAKQRECNSDKWSVVSLGSNSVKH